MFASYIVLWHLQVASTGMWPVQNCKFLQNTDGEVSLTWIIFNSIDVCLNACAYLSRCFPEARGWPELTMTEEDLNKNFFLLQPDRIATDRSEECTAPVGDVKYPDYEEFKEWQLGRSIYFRHTGERTYGVVVGRFIWLRSTYSTSESPRNLRLLVLIQKRTNKLILSSDVSEVEFDNGDMAKNREEVYIQGISLVGIVATLIANVTYVAGVAPPRGYDPLNNGIAFASHLAIPTVFLFFNALAFYASVLSVVLMTALIPIYGTAGEWSAIFLSSSVPVILSLVSFYVAFMISAWSIMDSWEKPFGMTLMGIALVVYIRFWAVELMHGHVERTLHICPRMSPWEWYMKREGKNVGQRFPGRLGRFKESCRTLAEMVEPKMWQHQFLGLGLHSHAEAGQRTRVLFGKNWIQRHRPSTGTEHDRITSTSHSFKHKIQRLKISHFM